MSVREYARRLERAVVESQEVRARYLDPASEIEERSAIEALLEVFDRRTLVRAMHARRARPAALTPVLRRMLRRPQRAATSRKRRTRA